MFNFKHQGIARLVLSLSIFINIYPSAVASVPDECTDTELTSLNSSLSSDIQEESEIDQFSDLFEDILQRVPFLSKKKHVHLTSASLREAHLPFFSSSSDVILPAYNEFSIVLGTGLQCLSARSNGVPFDVMGFIAAAESIRKIFSFKDIIHYIGDNHAKSCGFSQKSFGSLEELNEEVRQQKLLYEKIARKLGIEKTYKVVLASDFQDTPEFMEIKERVFTAQQLALETDYTKLEVADIEYFRKYQGVRIKVSWVKHDEEGHDAERDELLYDQLYKSIFKNEDMSFLYTRSGVNLSEKKSYTITGIDATPYSYPKADKRITLLPVDREVVEEIREFSTRFLCRLPSQEEETLKNIYVNQFLKILRSKLGKFPYDINDMRIRMDKLLRSPLDVLVFEFESMDQHLSNVPTKILKARDDILKKYKQALDEKHQEYRSEYQQIVDKALAKYQDIVQAVFATFPDMHPKSMVDGNDSLGESIQKIINYITAEEAM